jgi:hypothetical protein
MDDRRPGSGPSTESGLQAGSSPQPRSAAAATGDGAPHPLGAADVVDHLTRLRHLHHGSADRIRVLTEAVGAVQSRVGGPGVLGHPAGEEAVQVGVQRATAWLGALSPGLASGHRRSPLRRSEADLRWYPPSQCGNESSRTNRCPSVTRASALRNPDPRRQRRRRSVRPGRTPPDRSPNRPRTAGG